MVIHEIYPQAASGATLVLTPNILAGSALFFDKEGVQTGEGDASHRARGVIAALGDTGIQAGALAYNRIDIDLDRAEKRTFLMGLPRALDPSVYASSCAANGAELQRRIDQIGPAQKLMVAASAGVENYLAMLRTEKLAPADYAALFDPPAVKERRLLGMLGTWAIHQLKEQRRPTEARNHHPMPEGTPGHSPIGPIQDMALFQDIWCGDSANANLHALAAGNIPTGRSTTRVVIPGKTFTLSPAEAHILCDGLSRLAETCGTDLQAIFAPELYHSFTDDPEKCGRLGLLALGRLEADQALSYAPAVV